jgi:drug/metabolite transporter (DMT)-like permease
MVGERFTSPQLYGCSCILLGAVVASSGYLFLPTTSPPPHNTSTDITDTTESTDSRTSGGMALPVAIILYLASVVPSAFSNIYKEQRMKERDMNEYHTSSVVSFWQLWIGFAFLPLLSLPSLGA